MRSVPDKETLGHIAELFKGFADPTRVHILCLLLTEGELCVTDIAEKVEISQSAISHQLKSLKQMHLIRFRREGKNILYSLADDHVKTILQMGLEHAQCE
ncbi:MAG: helix-turn-helix transcriptional regulator [Oscillospiraceae bacterium]|nr:helix-turn-helix transcriptional regulator [Oscillospiraceae bacterium]